MTSRILIVDDHVLLAEGLALALGDAGHDARAAVDPWSTPAEAEAFDADLVVLDLDLGDGRLSTEFLPELVAAGRRVVILSGLVDDYVVDGALEAGAVATLAKTTDLDGIVADIGRLLDGTDLVGRNVRDQRVAAVQAERRRRSTSVDGFDQLTQREEVVLAALMDGLDAGTIAEREFVSLATVRSQIRSVLTKLGVNSQLAAVARAHRAGWHGSPTVALGAAAL